MCNYFLEGDLCNKDLENLKTWSFNWTEDLGYDLAPQGYDDLIRLAERVKTAFSEALPMPYSEDRYTVSNFQPLYKFIVCQRVENILFTLKILLIIFILILMFI